LHYIICTFVPPIEAATTNNQLKVVHSTIPACSQQIHFNIRYKSLTVWVILRPTLVQKCWRSTGWYYSLYIQGVPGGMCQTSGGCSLS